APGEIIFEQEHLVQVYRSDLDYAFKTDHKILPKWSVPQQVQNHRLNSYTLETLESVPLQDKYSAR
ncbi:hypothetical protein P692DRAFT_20736484, partial [Suillus brevipes Sb2]